MWGMPEGRTFTTRPLASDGDTSSSRKPSSRSTTAPAHAGHVIFFHREARFARSASAVPRLGRALGLPAGNQQDLIRSITTRLWPLGDDVRFVPGHGPMSTFGEERAPNPYVADRVLAGSRLTIQGQTMDENRSVRRRVRPELHRVPISEQTNCWGRF